MCGIAGVIGNPLPSRCDLERMRDALSHRGPDDAGIWIGPGAAVGHRRLAVMDPTPGGRQPMVSSDGRHVLAYNGEVYNDAELRARLADRLQRPWQTTCDTETLLNWLAAGLDVAEVRGMFAFAHIDTVARTLTLTRDPLGIKPMFWARLPGRVAFASEVQALLCHADLSAEPDPLGVSLYLSSVRTVMGAQTLFKGVHAVEPGEVLTFSLDNADRAPRRSRIEIVPAAEEPSTEQLREIVEDAVQSHLRSDVSLCAMLSGGLDSTIIVGCSRDRLESLRTYCAGADGATGDPHHATQVASHFGTAHRTALLDEAAFSSLWIDTVHRTGMPLATPNEVAIRLIARTLRADGQVVTLSGEGADELFAGYDAPLSSASLRGSLSGGRHELESNAWVPAELKPLLLVGELGHAMSDTSPLVDLYESAFDQANAGWDQSSDPVLQHLRFQRGVNLPMLLHRLDTATMLESVEGRTPFADARVAAAAAAIPLGSLFDPEASECGQRTKLALRRAFNDRVPQAVIERTKASFPVPFERWMSSVAQRARESSAARSIMQPALLDALADDPQTHWHLAWPVFNLVLWVERWWGAGLGSASSDQEHAASMRGTALSSRFV